MINLSTPRTYIMSWRLSCPAHRRHFPCAEHHQVTLVTRGPTALGSVIILGYLIQHQLHYMHLHCTALYCLQHSGMDGPQKIQTWKFERFYGGLAWVVLPTKKRMGASTTPQSATPAHVVLAET